MAQSCYIGLGHTPEELKKAKANLASMKSKNKKAMAPLIDEINAIDPTGLGKLADDVTADLANDVITPQQYKQTITDLHTKAQIDKAQKAVVQAQADVDALKFQLKKAEELDAKAKANLASQKSKSKKKANDLVDALQASGYDEEAIELSLSIDAMVNGTITPQELTEHINILKGLPGSTPPAVVVPPASIVPHTPPDIPYPESLEDVYYHITTATAAPLIEQQGFDLSKQSMGKVFGDGVYLAADPVTLAKYQKVYGYNPATYLTDPVGVVKTKIHIKPDNLIVVDAMPGSALAPNNNVSYVESVTPIRNHVVKVVESRTGKPSHYQEYIDEWLVANPKPLPADSHFDKQQLAETYAFTKVMNENGIEAIQIRTAPNGLVLGGDQLVVFNPKNVEILSASNDVPITDEQQILNLIRKYEKDLKIISTKEAIELRGWIYGSIDNKYTIDYNRAVTDLGKMVKKNTGSKTIPADIVYKPFVPKSFTPSPILAKPINPTSPVQLANQAPTTITQPVSPTPLSVPTTTPVTVVAPTGVLPVPSKADKWAEAWAAKPKNNTVMAKDFPWAKDEWMKANGNNYSPYVQDQGAKFPGMTDRQSQVVKAAQAKQLKFPLVDVTLQNAEFVPTQYGGLAVKVDEYIKKMPDDKFPRAYLWKGQYHLTNGHHRVMAAYIRGDTVLPVQVIDLDQLAVDGMFPGNLQDLVDGLNPPVASVPSLKLTDAEKAKFGKAPTPAQSAITAPPVGAGPSPASMAPSAPIGGFVVPPTTQQQLTNIQNILNQHPVFKSADDIKKAAKKASNDKFYAKKKVETAISQAMAGKNLQLEFDLTKLYDNIVAGKVVTDAKDVMKLIDDVKVNSLAAKAPVPSMPTQVITPPAAVITPPAATPVSANGMVTLYTVDDAIKHAVATTTNIGDALKELDTLVPLKELENWGIVKYDELIDAYINLGHAAPPWMFQYPVKIQKGQVSMPNAALAYYNTALPDFESKIGQSLDDVLGSSISDAIPLQNPTVGYASAVPTVPNAPTGSPVQLSTPSGVSAVDIYNQYDTLVGSVDAGMFVELAPANISALKYGEPGGLLENLHQIGTPDMNGKTPVMSAFEQWATGVNNLSPTTLPTTTPFIAITPDVDMPTIKSMVDNATLEPFPLKVFKYDGKYYVHGGVENLTAAKILDLPEVPVELYDLDDAIVQQLTLAATPPVWTIEQIDVLIANSELNIMMKKAGEGNPIPGLKLANVGGKVPAQNWALGKYQEVADKYVLAGLPVPPQIKNTIDQMKNPATTESVVKFTVAQWPMAAKGADEYITHLGYVPNPTSYAPPIPNGVVKNPPFPPKGVTQTVVSPTATVVNPLASQSKPITPPAPAVVTAPGVKPSKVVQITHTPKVSTGFTAAEQAYLDGVDNYLAEIQKAYGPIVDDAVKLHADAVAGKLSPIDLDNQLNKQLADGKQAVLAVRTRASTLHNTARYSYNVEMQLQSQELIKLFTGNELTIADANKLLDKLEAQQKLWNTPPYKLSGAVSSAKTGAKKKLAEAYNLETDPMKRQAINQLQDALVNGELVVYNASDVKIILAKYDLKAWNTKPVSFTFNNIPVLSKGLDPTYLTPMPPIKIMDYFKANQNGKVADIFPSRTTMANIEATLEPHQVDSLQKKLANVKQGSPTSVDTASTQWYSLDGTNFDPAKVNKLLQGDTKIGRPVAIKDGNKYYIVEGQETIAANLATTTSYTSLFVIDLHDVQLIPDLGKPAQYLVHAEQVDDAYRASAFSNVELKQAEQWMQSNSGKVSSKTHNVVKRSKTEPNFDAALKKAGMSESEYQNFVSWHINKWNDNSSKGSEMVALHLMAADEFKISPDVFRLTPNVQGDVPGAMKLLQKRDDVYRLMVRAMYANTQDAFKAAGITHVSLWRGYGYKENQPHMPEVFKDYLVGDAFVHKNEALPLTSWSTSKSTAEGFGRYKPWGYVTKASVPVEYLFATGVTGVGTGIGEMEFVMMAAPGTVEHTVLHRPDGLRRP